MASGTNRLTREKEFGSNYGPRGTAHGQRIGRIKESKEIYECSSNIGWRVLAATKIIRPIVPIRRIGGITICFAHLQCWFRRCASKLRTGVVEAERRGETRGYALDSFRGRAVASVSAGGRCVLEEVRRQSRGLNR